MNNDPKQPRTAPGRKGWIIAAGVLFLTVLPDLFIKKKGYFYNVEGWPGYFALLGLASCAVLFVAAKILEPLLRKPENYYD